MKEVTIPYKIFCYAIIIIELGFIVFALVTKLQTGQVAYFGVKYNQYQAYFPYLTFLEISLIVFLVLWAIASFIAAAGGVFSLRKKYIIVGLVGVVLSIVYVVWYPFGSIAYLLN